MAVANSGQPQSASSQAITALVLGLIGIFPCCSLLGPIAWFIGNQEVKAIAQGRAPVAGEGIAKAAVILGIIGTLWLVGMVVWIGFWGGLAVVESWINR